VNSRLGTGAIQSRGLYQDFRTSITIADFDYYTACSLQHSHVYHLFYHYKYDNGHLYFNAHNISLIPLSCAVPDRPWIYLYVLPINPQLYIHLTSHASQSHFPLSSQRLTPYHPISPPYGHLLFYHVCPPHRRCLISQIRRPFLETRSNRTYHDCPRSHWSRS